MENLKKRIGVLGGGQLGRMLAEAASPLDISVTCLDPAGSEAPAASVAREVLKGDFRNELDICRLAEQVDVLTYEIEHVDIDAIEKCLLKFPHLRIEPAPSTVRMIQDKYRQKVFLQKLKIPVADFCAVKSLEDVEQAAEGSDGVNGFGYPMMLKSKTLAYDGRGNAVITCVGDILLAIDRLGGLKALENEQLYVEKWARFSKELAVMVAKDTNGNVQSYPVVETIQKDSICHTVIAPAQIDSKAEVEACAFACEAVKHLQGAGVYGVELFILESGNILLNEIAPRPHNSGHYTIEACYTSQFEQHLRAVAGLPLGDCGIKVGGAVMLNVLGLGNGPEAMEKTFAMCSDALAIPGATFHWYGKKDCKQGRKMAHITFVAESTAKAQQNMNLILKDSSLSLREKPLVGVIMGSDSDLPTMKACAQILKDFEVAFELTVVSAHRTPERLVKYARTAHERGLKVIIAAAGGAAHLPGMAAAMTPLPVIGVPVALKHLDGVDSLHSIVQMPRGVPVATVAIDNSTNAALLAIRILAAHDTRLLNKMLEFQRNMETMVLEKAQKLETVGWEKY